MRFAADRNYTHFLIERSKEAIRRSRELLRATPDADRAWFGIGVTRRCAKQHPQAALNRGREGDADG